MFYLDVLFSTKEALHRRCRTARAQQCAHQSLPALLTLHAWAPRCLNAPAESIKAPTKNAEKVCALLKVSFYCAKITHTGECWLLLLFSTSH